MRNLILAVFVSILAFGVTGCFTTPDGKPVEITSEATHQAIAYAGGKAMGIGINELVPQVDADLGNAWKGLMERNKGVDIVPSNEMIMFYNNCIAIIALHTEDPYGLIADLGVFLMIFGAQFNQAGDMIAIQPVPMVVLQMFEMGYRNGKMVALRE